MSLARNKFKAKLKSCFIHDWEVKLVCLFLAFLLWHVVKDQVNRMRRDTWPVDLPSRSMKA